LRAYRGDLRGRKVYGLISEGTSHFDEYGCSSGWEDKEQRWIQRVARGRTRGEQHKKGVEQKMMNEITSAGCQVGLSPSRRGKFFSQVLVSQTFVLLQNTANEQQ
jgi:hypothetical protein